jgi:hypothetical protein
LIFAYQIATNRGLNVQFRFPEAERGIWHDYGEMNAFGSVLTRGAVFESSRADLD